MENTLVSGKRKGVYIGLFSVVFAIGLAAEIILLATAAVEEIGYFGHISVIVNLFADLWLIAAALRLILGYDKTKRISRFIGGKTEGLITAYLLAVAIIFWILFIWGESEFIAAGYLSGWTGVFNVFNNAVMPVFMLLVWIFLPTEQKRLGKHLAFGWILPIYLYFSALIITGLITGKFLYGFLDPYWAAKYTIETVSTLLLAVAIVLVFGLIFYSTGRIVIAIRNAAVESAERERIRNAVEEARAERASGVKAYAKSAEVNAWAQLVLGAAYERGDGVPRDCETAAKWYAVAASVNNADALNNLGVLYQKGEGVPQSYGEAAELYARAAALGNAKAEYNLGNLYAAGAGVPQSYEKAAGLYLKAAEKGLAKAQSNLAICYGKGLGVPQDYVKATEWNGKAAERGEVYAVDGSGMCRESASYPCGYIYEKVFGIDESVLKNRDSEGALLNGLACERGLGTEKNAAAAAEWYKAAGDLGDARALNKLGNCYYDGRGVPQNYEKAVELYEKAANAGNADAAYNLGNCYYYGKGVQRDGAKATEFYQKAADKGCADALNALAECYENGKGVLQDREKAESFRKTAAEKGAGTAARRGVAGYPDGADVLEIAALDLRELAAENDGEAQFILGVSYENGRGVPKNYEKAAEWYGKAAANGNAEALNNLGALTQRGVGAPQDYARAFELYARAAKQNNANALYNLGNCYYNGWGAPRDEKKAAELYARAAELGQAKAQNNLAYMYEKGDGVPRDADKAAKLYGEAVRGGDVYARELLGMCREPAEYPEGVAVRDMGEYDVVGGRLVQRGESAGIYGGIEDEEALAAEARAEEIARAKEEALAEIAAEEAARAEAAATAKAGAEEIARVKEKARAEALAEIAAEEAARTEAAEARAEEIARAKEEASAATAARETAIAEETAKTDDEDYLESVESFSVVKGKGKLVDEDDETAVFDAAAVPEGYRLVYQDGWYYVSETGDKLDAVGVRDDYYYSLPDRLKPEFRDLFVDGKVISIPRFPFYVIDGDNTMFFRLVFTFITRYRKIISIELLDNLYGYLVQKFSEMPQTIAKLNDKLIRIYFARRSEENVLEKCEAKCREDVDFCLKYVPNYPANLYSFKRLIMILEKQDKLREAEALCVKAIDLGLVDGTKAGYKGRLSRIREKLSGEENG
ncbi:MAG: hypothetical protein LBP79_06985 [Clostridiales bacterium]|jgi:TPR repeat protein|nr:hypothetical protein [Clostridiales bacterium]